jgi:hypothetical protein
MGPDSDWPIVIEGKRQRTAAKIARIVILIFAVVGGILFIQSMNDPRLQSGTCLITSGNSVWVTYMKSDNSYNNFAFSLTNPTKPFVFFLSTQAGEFMTLEKGGDHVAIRYNDNSFAGNGTLEIISLSERKTIFKQQFTERFVEIREFTKGQVNFVLRDNIKDGNLLPKLLDLSTKTVSDLSFIPKFAPTTIKLTDQETALLMSHDPTCQHVMLFW